MRHIKVYEDFLNESKAVNEGSYFAEDKTEVKNPKAYSTTDLNKAVEDIAYYTWDGVKPKVIRNGIQAKHKGNVINYMFDGDDGCWYASFEHRYGGDSAQMSLDEFVSEFKSWYTWFKAR